MVFFPYAKRGVGQGTIVFAEGAIEKFSKRKCNRIFAGKLCDTVQ